MRKTLIFLALSIIIASTEAYSLTITGNDVIDIHGSEFLVSTYDNSTLTAYSGSELGWVSAYDYSAININGGQITNLSGGDNTTINLNGGTAANLFGYGASTINITGGSYSYLKVYDSTVTNISYLDNLAWLMVNDDSVVNIYGSEFQYSGGHLSGIWGNGDLFSFWAIPGSSGYGNTILPNNIILHSVPEPSSLALFVVGLVLLIYRKNSNQAFNWTFIPALRASTAAH